MLSEPKHSGGDTESPQSRGLLYLRRRALAADWSAQPGDAAARQQLPLHRAQTRCDRWRLRIHSERMEESDELSKNQRSLSTSKFCSVFV